MALRFLNVELKLLADNFNNGIKAAQKEAKEFEKTLRPSKELLEDMGTAFTVAGVAIVGSMTAMAKSAADYGGKLLDASKRTGARIQELAKLKFAAEQSGASFDEVSAGVRCRARNAEAAASGVKAQQIAFKELGISVTDSSGKLRPLSALLGDVSDRFSRMQDGTEKAAKAQELFGRGGAALIPLLNEGQAGLKAMGDQAERLGLVISEDAAKAGDEFNDTLDQMKSAMQGLSNVIGQAILPSLTAVARQARDAIIAFKDWAKEHEGLTKALYATGAALTGAGGVALGIAGVLALLPKLQVAIAGVAGALSGFTIAIGAAIGLAITFRKEIAMGLVGAFS